jgi:hypothetical protein
MMAKIRKNKMLSNKNSDDNSNQAHLKKNDRIQSFHPFTIIIKNCQ